MNTKKQKNVSLVMVVGLLTLPFFSAIVLGGEVEGLSKACKSSPECVAAAEREEEANRNAAEAKDTANAYQRKVNDTAIEIATMQRMIAESQAHIEDLQDQITETEKKIEDAQEALAELLVKMHFEADAEPIKVLAGASSISDLAERSARQEVAKEQINVQANRIKEAKVKLEEDKVEVEEQLKAQEIARGGLVAKRQEQETLVAQYRDNADAYEAAAAKAREEKQAAERKWQEEHQSSLTGLAYYSGDDTYPWQADCPQKQDFYSTTINGRKIGGYVCECVSYVGWKAYEAYGLYLGWGNAYSWDDGARAAGYTVNHTPAPETIGQVDGYPYGHVFWVESVNGDGSINVTEYNNAYATKLYSGSSHYGDFGARVIPAYEVSRYNYIHLED